MGEKQRHHQLSELFAVYQFRVHTSLSPSPKTSLRAGGTHLAVVARGLASYLHVALESRDAEKVSRNINEQTTKWILSMFK